MITNRFLFNFAASYSGGGFKRLYSYAQWFNQHGGSTFIIHSNCDFLIKEFPKNRYFIVSQSKLERLFRDCDYLKKIILETGVPELYYSYGIPIYYKLGKLNWFHVSNVLPLGSQGVPLPLFDKLKLGYLGRRIKNNFKNTDIISAESSYSLSLIHPKHSRKFFVSVNGSDDEISFYNAGLIEKKDKIATVMGTYSYKALDDSLHVFEMLRAMDKQLKLIIMGDDRKVPASLRSDPDIILTGILSRDEVVHYLRKSEYYISTTHIENSYNAASEGVFFANESYISDIAPHRELIAGMNFEHVSIPNMSRPLLRLKRDEVNPSNLKTWDKVVTEIVEHVRSITANQDIPV